MVQSRSKRGEWNIVGAGTVASFAATPALTEQYGTYGGRRVPYITVYITVRMWTNKNVDGYEQREFDTIKGTMYYQSTNIYAYKLLRTAVAGERINFWGRVTSSYGETHKGINVRLDSIVFPDRLAQMLLTQPKALAPAPAKGNTTPPANLLKDLPELAGEDDYDF